MYGVADYCGGRATREASAFAVTAFGQSVSLALLLVVLPVLGDPSPPLADWLWGAGAGIGGAIGLLAFYHALSKGSMTVVAPTTAVVSVSIPVAVGLALGERPGAVALIGIGVADHGDRPGQRSPPRQRDPDPAADHRVLRASAASASG